MTDANEPPSSAATAVQRVGVIDVGSNSVRLVVYRGGGRVPVLLFNEKVLCGLGRHIHTSGVLDSGAMTLALSTIRRFAALAREMGVARLDIVATAAVRDAANGGELAAEIQRRTGQPLRILSGDEEARLAAMGVLAAMPGARGLVGDLGGGSLEVVAVGASGIGNRATLPVGPLQVIDAVGENRRRARAFIDERLGAIDWLAAHPGGDFIAVGGAWRAIAKMQIAAVDYPLAIVHHYTVDARVMRVFAERIAGLGREALRAMPAVTKKRIATLPWAALALASVIEHTRAARVIFSAYGLREGLLYSQLPPDVQARDPLLEECRAIAHGQGRFRDHGDELFGWIDPLFPDETPATARLRRAACLLSDIAWRGRPDLRADLALAQVLDSQFVGVDHAGLALIALALYVSYGGNLSSPRAAAAASLLDKAGVTTARRIGLALRLGQRLSGGTAGLLRKSALVDTGHALMLRIEAGHDHLVGEVVRRRLKALGDAFGKPTHVECSPRPEPVRVEAG